jgi:hypothetical protein
MASNYIRAVSGRYGYLNDNVINSKLKVPYIPESTTQSLFPGEGVYSMAGANPGTFPSASGAIKYAGLKKIDNPEVSNTSLFANGALLTYNINTDKRGTAEDGTLTGKPAVSVSIAESSDAARSRQAELPLKSYVIDARDMLRHNKYGDWKNINSPDLYGTTTNAAE